MALRSRALTLLLAASAFSTAPLMSQSSPGSAPESESSLLAIPIRLNLEPIFQMAERTAPVTPPGVETWTPLPDAKGAAVFRYNLYREPMLFQLGGNRLKVLTMTNYWLELGVKAGSWIKGVGSCGQGREGFRRAMLGVQADFGLTPNWGLTLKATPLAPVAVTPCQLTAAGVDITPKVLASMRDALTRATQAMEQQAQNNALLRQKAEAVWNLARQPIQVSKGIYLLLNPEKIRLAPLRSEGKTLIITPEIQAHPAIIFGPPPAVTTQALPNLEQLPSGSANGLKLHVDADLPYSEATTQLRRQIAGKTFDTAKGSFKVLDVTVRGEKDKALLTVDLKGKVNGKLTLIGKPVFDAKAGTLRLEDLDFTLESKSWITSFGEWLYHSTLKKTLSDKANWFLNRSLNDLKGTVQSAMNRDLAPGLHMSGALADLRPGQPQVLADRFRLDAVLEGQLQIDVNSLPGK